MCVKSKTTFLQSVHTQEVRTWNRSFKITHQRMCFSLLLVFWLCNHVVTLG